MNTELLKYKFLNYFTDSGDIWLSGYFNRMPETFQEMVDLEFITLRDPKTDPQTKLAIVLYVSMMDIHTKAKLYQITFKGLWKLFLYKRSGGLIV